MYGESAVSRLLHISRSKWQNSWCKCATKDIDLDKACGVGFVSTRLVLQGISVLPSIQHFSDRCKNLFWDWGRQRGQRIGTSSYLPLSKPLRFETNVCKRLRLTTHFTC
jgi:hypothetical protein